MVEMFFTDIKKGRTTNWTVTSMNRHEWNAIEEAKVRPIGNVRPTKKTVKKKEEKKNKEKRRGRKRRRIRIRRRRKRRRKRL